MAGPMTDFDAALETAAALDEVALARPWLYRDRPTDVRYALYRTLEDAQEAHVRVAARPHPESRRILSLAQRAFGDLRGLLVGLSADLLDQAPREGEWPVRETLRHMLVVERRYALQTLYATERSDSDPMRIPDDRLPTPAQIDVTGGIRDILGRIGAARAGTDRRLADLTPAAMTRPTVWVHYEIDVRFRLHRFAAHVVEHTIQCEKTLAALGWRPTEGRRIARRLAALVGEIEGLGGLAEARDIENRLAERLASTTAA
jgi:DinB family protein